MHRTLPAQQVLSFPNHTGKVFQGHLVNVENKFWRAVTLSEGCFSYIFNKITLCDGKPGTAYHHPFPSCSSDPSKLAMTRRGGSGWDSWNGVAERGMWKRRTWQFRGAWAVRTPQIPAPWHLKPERCFDKGNGHFLSASGLSSLPLNGWWHLSLPLSRELSVVCQCWSHCLRNRTSWTGLFHLCTAGACPGLLGRLGHPRSPGSFPYSCQLPATWDSFHLFFPMASLPSNSWPSKRLC